MMQDRFRPRGDFLAGRSERNGVSPPLDEPDVEFLFEFLHLHRERRLRDGALVRRHAEMTRARECFEVAELSERHHADKNN
jgi:hypothetical protein